jgi:hypothetical protein
MTTDVPLMASPTIAALVAALARAQATFPQIEKGKRATIATKSGGHFSYSYAALSDVVAAVVPALSANELALLQPVQMIDGTLAVSTMLAHTSGEWIAMRLEVPVTDPADVRATASAITYLRRYGATSLLALAPTDEDDDAAAAVEGKPDPQSAKPRAPRPAKAAPADTPVTPESRISHDDQRRLFKLATDAGWSHAAILSHLRAKYRITRTDRLTQAQYDELVATLFTERPGSSAPAREPGEEG